MLKLNINDLVHILKQIKIAENHTATGELVDHLGNPLNALTPYGMRTVTGEYNNLATNTAGSADQLMPRQTTPVWNPAEPNPRTGQPTSYESLSGSVYDSQPRIISNLIADQSLKNPVAVISALSYVGITSGPLYNNVMAAADAARVAIIAAEQAEDGLTVAQTAFVAAGSLSASAEAAAVEEAQLLFSDASAQRDAAMTVAVEQLSLAGVEMQSGNLVMPNIMTDLGSTAPLNGFMTIFGQFFDHGLTMINKGGNGTVYIPLQPDDPLYVPGSPTNFMVLTRSTNLPGADGILGTADDIREATNVTTPWIDLNQTYASNESHQVFLREYKMVDGKPVATGWLLEGANGGPPTWADIKLQAKNMLGIELDDMAVHRVPLLATDLYGNFIPGANGFAQLVTGTNMLVEGDPAAPVLASTALATGHVFLADIAHNADPKAGQTADADTDIGNAIPLDPRGNRATYDNELLDKHYVVGDGRGNENIALTAIHHVFHSEHNHRVDQIKAELIANGDVALLNEWLDVEVQEIPADAVMSGWGSTLQWNGERLFQASRFTTEQVYQHLVFEEFVRLVSPNIDPFVFSNTVDIDPAITAEFAHAVYRFGHSQLNETVPLISADGQTQTDMSLIEAFLNPVAFEAAGANAEEAAGAIIRGMSRQVSNEIDEYVTDALRTNLVGLPLDLAAINIARGRETGVPSLNAVRADFFAQTGDTQLEPYSSWFDFALAIKTPASVINFIAAYGQHQSILSAVTVEEKRDAAMTLVMGGLGAPGDRLDFLNGTGDWAGQETGLNLVDFWIGGLAEKKMAFGGLLGSTFTFVFEVQMENLQAGDRFYYLSRSQGMNLLNELEGDSWAKLAMRNTDLEAADATHLPSSLFLTPAYILELNEGLQNMVDPIHDNMILQAISPMVIRKDMDGDGVNDYLRYTGVDHVVLGGTQASDTLIGGEGDDTLWGGAGDDRLEGGQGVDHISGGYGDDIITDSGTPAGAADVLSGEDGNDVISAGEGLDLIFGGRGQDFIIGGRDGKTVTSGEGNDFAKGGVDMSMVQGNEGDDWLEGGDGLDTLAGENSELFFNSPIIGHDVLNGRGNDNDYDAESGDDIMFQGPGIQRNNGMAGFDWAINKDNPGNAESDMGIPIFVNQQNLILRDRYDRVEGLSGWNGNDTLTGRDVAAGGIVVDPTAPFLSYSDALTSSAVGMIDGFGSLVAHLGRETITAAGKQHEVVVFDTADIIRDADGVATGVTNQPHDIILGGAGSDIIQGKAGNDIIDGDRWLNVRIGINDVDGNPMASAEHMTSQVVDLDGNVMFLGKTLDQLMLTRDLNPGQLYIVREMLDGNKAGDQDVAAYRDIVTNYSFVRNADGSTTVTHATVPQGVVSDGVDRLFNMEKLSFSDGNGGTVVYDINALVPVAATGAPTISDTTPVEGQVLTVDLTTIIDPNGVINPAIQWQSSTDNGTTWTNIAGATGASYTATQAEVGAMVRVQVAWTDLAQTAEMLVSAPTAPVADLPEAATGAAVISDTTPAAGQVLTIDTATIADPNGVGPLSHQWQVSADNGVTWTNIAGATGTSYTPSPAQIGSLLKVVTTFTDITTGTLETLTSAVTAAIVQGPIAATGAPVISDLTPTETQALTLNVSSIADANGLGTLSYQWQASTNNGVTWTNIAGATNASFTPGQAQVGSILRVSASFTDGIGTVETLTSSVTGVVGDSFTGFPLLLTTFNGTAGDDIANGADAASFLGGNDTMSGLAGNDVLNGRNGNDTITGGAGNDTINGGTGTDTAVFAGASSNFTMSSNGTTITVTDNTAAEGVDAVTAVETLRFNGVNHSVVTGTTLANTINGAAGNEAIFALAGNDTINGGAGNDLIYANGGVDSITQASATGGRDFVDGGLDEDTFTVTTDTTTAEAFVIYTRAAAIAAIPGVVLNANTEIVITRNGAVMTELDNVEEIVVSTLRVTSPDGANGGTVSGDTISVVGDFNQTSLNFNTITIDGNTGNDTVDISALESAHRIVFTSNGGQDTIIGDLRPQDIVNMDPNAVTPSHHTMALPTAEEAAPAAAATEASAPAVAMETPAPVIEAAPVAMEAPAPVMEAAPVAAVEAAPVMDQVFQGGSASDILVADAGDDRLSGGSNDDYLYGMAGDDFLSGGSGNDGLDGGEGDDTLSGGSGNDYLDGGAGDDELTGGTGNDTFAFGNGDTVTDFAAGQDMIDLSAMGVTEANFAEMVSISAVRGGARITIGSESMLIANTNPAALTAAQFTLAAEASAPVVEEPSAPVVEAPAAPAVEAPVAPVVEAPAAPVVEAPVAPVVEAPAAPVVEAPAAPVVEAPAAPVVEAPAAPVVEAPAAPVVEAPAAPVVEAPAAPVVEAPAAPVVEAPAAPVVEAPAAPVTPPAAAAPEYALTQSDLTGLKALVNGQPYGESITGVRTLEGDGNNLANPEYGAGGTPFIRLTEARYGEAITTVDPDTGETIVINRAVNPIFAGLDARMISNVIGAQEANLAPQANKANMLLSAFGQYADHGMGFLAKGGSGMIQIGAPGSGRTPGTDNPADLTRGSVVGFDADGNPLHMNMTSNFVDQNQAYGTGTLVGTFLRAGNGEGGSGATLFVGDPDPSNPAFDLLPTLRQLIEEHWANDTLFADGDFQTSFQTYYSGLVAEDGTINAAMVKEMASDFMGSGQPLLLDTNPFINLLDHIVAGDGRVNENVTLTSVHTIWARNHNFHVENLKAAGFEGSAEELYQAAKIINESEYARVVWTDFTDSLLGGMRGNGSHGWEGYNPDANPGISQEFAAAGYRFGHSLIQQTVRVLNDQGQPVDVTLFDAFLNPSNDPSVFTAPIEQLQARGYNPQPGYAELGANAIIGGIVTQPAEEVDANIVDAVRNDLVRINADLFSFNVARGRDLGLGTMNQVREALANSTDPYVREAVSNVVGGLSPYASWEDFQARNKLSDEVIAQFKQAYPDLVLETQEAIDAFVAANPDIVLVDGNTVKGIDRVDLWVGGLTEAHVNGGVVGSTFWVILHEQFDRLQEADRFYYLTRVDNFDFYQANVDADGFGFATIVARNTGLTGLAEKIFEVAKVPGGLNPVVDASIPAVDVVAPVDALDPVADAPAPEAAAPTAPVEVPTTPVVDLPVQVIDAPAAPVEETPAPVVDAPSVTAEETPVPVIEAPLVPIDESPVLDVPAMPVEETPAPVVDTPAAPVEETPAPVVDAPAVPVAETPAPVVEAPAVPVEETPAPVVDTPAAPVEETPAPVIDTPAPVAELPIVPVDEASIPVVDIPAVPVEELPVPPVETPAVPVSETPAPVETPSTPIETPEAEEIASIELSGSSRSDVLLGGGGDDVLSGLRGKDRLYGEAGDDLLMGGRGNDVLMGGEGTDTLFGGSGLDFLDGGEGSDILSGGKGSDTFVFGDGDLVLDFKSGVDMIDLTALGITEASFETSVSFSRVGADTLVTVGSQSMTLKNSKEIDFDDFSLAQDTLFDSLLSDAMAIVDDQSASARADIGGSQTSNMAEPAMIADLSPYAMHDSGMLGTRPLEPDYITPVM